MPNTRGSIVLASGSPRRFQLLEAACFAVEVRPQDADETWPGGDPAKAAITLACRKMRDVRAEEMLVLAADTAVVVDDRVLGKPATDEEACEMLGLLAGREHRVITGVCMAKSDKRTEFAISTRVWFRALNFAEIRAYVNTGDCVDKAGAYGIQGRGAFLVERLDGSYTNVVGLPVSEVICAVEALS